MPNLICILGDHADDVHAEILESCHAQGEREASEKEVLRNMNAIWWFIIVI